MPPTPESRPRRLDRSSKGPYRMLGRTDREVLSHVRRALRAHGPAMTRGQYVLWRRHELARFDRPLPTVGQLKERYGSFSEAVCLADPSLQRRGLRLAGKERIAHQQRIAAVHARAKEDTPDSAAAPPAAAESGAAALVLGMATGLTRVELRDLERHLRRRLSKTKKPAAARRVELLRPLAELLETEPDLTVPFPLIARSSYEARRNPQAPPSERLQRIYGSWVSACRAASGVRADGRKEQPGAVGVPVKVGREGKLAPYTRDNVIAAVRLCADETERTVGIDLSSHEYHCWSIERAARLRRNGQSPRIPSYGQITRLFRADAERAGSTIWAAVIAACSSAKSS